MAFRDLREFIDVMQAGGYLRLIDPSESVQVLRSWTSDLDPRVPPEKRANGDYTSGRMLIDACRPFTWREQFASPNRFSEPMRKRIWQKWLADLEKTRSAGGA
jgi:hypothetical protein